MVHPLFLGQLLVDLHVDGALLPGDDLLHHLVRALLELLSQVCGEHCEKFVDPLLQGLGLQLQGQEDQLP